MLDSIEIVARELAEMLTYSESEMEGSSREGTGDTTRLSTGKEAFLKSERFHRFSRRAPPWRTLAVDASVKSVLDCGAFLVVLLKVAFEVWQLGSRRVKEGIETHVQLVRSPEAARQKMAVLEFELAERATTYLSEGDLAILDRPLCLRPKSYPRLKQSMEILASSLEESRVGLLGVCKSSRLNIEGGAPLIGFLLHHAARMGITGPWFYYPLVESTTPSTLRIGQPCVASLEPAEDFAFRIDLGANIDQPDDIAASLGSISTLGDRFAYGYPYPLRSVHEACSISCTEVDICRQQLLEAASRRGVSSNLRYALKATSFREEVLLS